MKLSEALEIYANSDVDDVDVTVHGYVDEESVEVFMNAVDVIHTAACWYEKLAKAIKSALCDLSKDGCGGDEPGSALDICDSGIRDAFNTLKAVVEGEAE